MIIYSETYERAGNDSWLIDRVQLIKDEFGLYITHKKLWTGWGNDIKEDNTIYLDIDDLEMSQKKIDIFIENNSLFDEYPSGHKEGIQINLRELLSGEE